MHLMYFTEQPMSAYSEQAGREGAIEMRGRGAEIVGDEFERGIE